MNAEAKTRIGDDCDTVAAIAAAYWGQGGE